MSDTRTIRDVVAKKIGWVQQPVVGLLGSSLDMQIAYQWAGDYLVALGLDPDTVLERKCERCYGIGMLHETIGTIDHCPDCGGSGWITVNRIMVVPVHHHGPPGPDIAEMLRALRIGRAVLACSAGTVDERVYMPGGDWTSRPDVLLRRLLAAGDDE